MKQHDRSGLQAFLSEYLGYGELCFDVIFDSGERFTAVVREKTKTGDAEYSYGNWTVLDILCEGSDYSVISLKEVESVNQLYGH